MASHELFLLFMLGMCHLSEKGIKGNDNRRGRDLTTASMMGVKRLAPNGATPAKKLSSLLPLPGDALC